MMRFDDFFFLLKLSFSEMDTKILSYLPLDLMFANVSGHFIEQLLIKDSYKI